MLFDSFEIPGNCMSCATELDKSDTIDLSFAKGVLHLLIF